MIQNIVGSPARVTDFFNREELIELLWNRLETGNVLLAAPRRFGKTSLMYHLIDHPKQGWKPVHVDAESIAEPVNFIIALLDSLMADKKIRMFLFSSWQKASSWARNLFKDVKLETPWDVGLKISLKEKIGPHWQQKGEELLRTLRSFNGNKKLLIIIDELPVMLHLFRGSKLSDHETRMFLYWFRKLRTDPRMGLTNCRFLVGGSIGIEHYLSRLNASDSFNDFERVQVPELSAEQGADLLKKLLVSRKVKLSTSTQKKILELIGAPIPYFIQIFVTEIATEKAHGLEQIGPKRVEEIYQQRILGTCKTYFQYYYDRLRYYDRPQERAAKALLKELALAKSKVVSKNNLYAIYRKELGESATSNGFAQLMGDLENDFYIEYCPAQEGYFFASRFLCDWWRRYYAF